MNNLILRSRSALIASLITILSSTLVLGVETNELFKLRTELAAASQSRGEDHPEVKNLRSRIRSMEDELSAVLGRDSEITIDFAGGTLGQLIAHLATHQAPLNIVAEKADMAAEIPAFSIRNARPAAAARAISGFLVPRGYILEMPSSKDEGRGSVYTVRRRNEGSARFEAFQISSILEDLKIDDVIGAIRDGWQLNERNSPGDLKLKFHPATGVLLVSGPDEGIVLTNKILEQMRLRGQSRKRAAESPAAPKEK